MASCDATLPSHIRDAKAARRRSRRIKWNKRLRQLTLEKAAAQRRQITSMRIDGQISFDRELWTEGCQVFGQERFGDACNDLEVQRRRFEYYLQLAENEIKDGNVYRLDAWDVIRARSELGSGASGPDQLPPAVWQKVLFLVLF